MQRFWVEIDLHVAAMLLMLAPAACLNWWGLVVILLIPQGRIGTRAFVDYPSFTLPHWAYLAANEALVFGVVGVLAGVRFAVALPA